MEPPRARVPAARRPVGLAIRHRPAAAFFGWLLLTVILFTLGRELTLTPLMLALVPGYATYALLTASVVLLVPSRRPADGRRARRVARAVHPVAPPLGAARDLRPAPVRAQPHPGPPPGGAAPTALGPTLSRRRSRRQMSFATILCQFIHSRP